jgi:uncharacterized protein (TIGR00730 family)
VPGVTVTPELNTSTLARPINDFLDALGVTGSRALFVELLTGVSAMIRDDVDTLDLKIASAAVREMAAAFELFQPFRTIPKVTLFGSARTSKSDPLYAQARAIAARLADEGWMVITGAGPGIMEAGMEGAGRDRSIGVAIRLPFEQAANSVIAGDHKYVAMKYFFTRKLMLIKESKGFVCLPGGFGTLDEMFELLTLTQTGKGVPVPIVLLDVIGDQYWEALREFIQSQLVARGLVRPTDTQLFLITDDVDLAAAEITRFYANYDSLRYVGDDLVIRMKIAPNDDQLADLNEQFGHLCAAGRIVRSGPLSIEVRERDAVELARIRFAFARHSFGDLRRLIDTVNGYAAEGSGAPRGGTPVGKTATGSGADVSETKP